jgi:hypothetical protein
MHKGVAKTILNALLSRNVLALGIEERKHLVAVSGLGLLYLPARAIQGRAVSGITARNEHHAFKYNLINYAPLRADPLEHDKRYRFIAEILENKPYWDTELFRLYQAGEDILRAVIRDTRTVDGVLQKDARRSVSSEEDFKAHHARVVALIDSIRTHGYLDVERDREFRRSNRTGGTTAGVAIDDQGNFLHRIKGRHRIAIAHQLNIERLPVAINFISGRYFRRFLKPSCFVSEERFIAAMKTAVEAAAARHRA